MKYLISTTALGLAVCLTPAMAAANSYNSGYGAHEACKRSEDNRQVLGGLAGAVVGGVFGSQVSGSGARTEGSAIGAVLGGLAGAGIADKTIDCDPVYTTSSTGYPAASTSQYGASSYGSAQPSAPSYGQTYGTTTYSGSQNHYEDRVTVSNHPVYSEPYYGAGAVSQGRTYSSGTVSYPPSGSNIQYASSTTYNAPSYHAPAVTTQYVSAPSAPVTTRQYVPLPVTTTRSYVSAQPISQRVVYSSPAPVSYVQHRPHKVRKMKKWRKARRGSHYHGSYGCDMGH